MNYVVGIGACNVDLYVKSKEQIKNNYDHPSIITSSPGGVTRNILETIGKLGIKTYLLSCIGDDKYGEYIIENSKNYIDFSKVKKVKDFETSKFVQLFDNNNDMQAAYCDMSAIDKLDVNYIKENDELIRNASAIIIDPSLKLDVIDYLLDTYKDNYIFIDPVSDHYASVIKSHIKNAYVIKPNIKELKQLVGKEIKEENEIIDACKELLKRGVQNVITTTKGHGSFFVSEDEVIKVKFKRIENVVNASGAGDCFLAALVYSFINKVDKKHALELANAAGQAAIRSKSVTAGELSVKILEEIVKENIK